MAIVAPASKYKIKTYLIYIVAVVALAAYCVYDGYFSQSFKDKHIIDGKPDKTMVANQNAPYFLGGLAVLMGLYLLVIRGRKIVAEDNALVINSKLTIPYDSIQKIDKTDFDTKGCFVITCKTSEGR